MDNNDMIFFEEIKERAKKDTELWNKANADESCSGLSSKKEDEIMERMFLVYYTEKYLEQKETIQQLETELMMLR